MTDSIQLYDLLKKSTDAALKMQREDGSMPPGENGIYGDEETPVKTTGFWLVTYSNMFKLTGDDSFRAAADAAADYLISKKARPGNATFQHRIEDGKDNCNGLIGQAFSIESLSFAGQVLDRPELTDLATEVFLSHPYDDTYGVWMRREVDGSTLPYDRTFNHQLWFAAAGGLLAKTNNLVYETITHFLNNLLNILDVEENGLIRHPLRLKLKLSDLLRLFSNKERPYLLINEFLARLPLYRRHRRLYEKAIGYQSVNLYALSLLKKSFPDHTIWSHEIIRDVICYIKSKEYLDRISENKKAYTNIPTGFENAFALETFEDDTENAKSWVVKQIKQSFDFDTMFMTKSATDPRTQAANIYRACRLPNYSINTNL